MIVIDGTGEKGGIVADHNLVEVKLECVKCKYNRHNKEERGWSEGKTQPWEQERVAEKFMRWEEKATTFGEGDIQLCYDAWIETVKRTMEEEIVREKKEAKEESMQRINKAIRLKTQVAKEFRGRCVKGLFTIRAWEENYLKVKKDTPGLY